MSQMFWIGGYFTAALALGVLCVFGLGLLLHAGTRIRRELLPLVLLAILIATMAAPLVTGRVITKGFLISGEAMEDISSSFWITRIITLIVLAVSAERILRFIIHREWADVRGWSLFFAFVVFALSNQVTNGIFGSHPSFDHKYLYAFPVYFGFFLVAQTQAEACLRFARNSLLLFFVCSAIAAVIMPEAVIEKGYSGILPGLSIRYHGLGTHANGVGPLAVTLMICLWRFPYHSPRINLFSWFLVSVSLILSQSKTSLIISGIVWILLALYRYGGRKQSSQRSAQAIGITTCFCFLASAAIAVAWLGMETGPRFLDRLAGTGADSLTSLTGRTFIWAISWQEFLANPVFGYGPSIWGPAYRMSAGFLIAPHAHNQLLQSLSSAGVIGAVGLLFYVLALTIYAVRAAKHSEGLSLALVALIIIRSFTETPLNSTSVMQLEFFVHLLVLVACIGFLPEKHVIRTSSIRSRDIPNNRAQRRDMSVLKPMT